MATLTDLSDDVVKFTTYDDTDFVAEIPTFIRLAEEQIWYTIQLPAYRDAQTGNMTQGNPYLTLPTGFLAASSLSIKTPLEGWKFLLNKDVEYIREVYPDEDEEGEPFAYAQFEASGNTVVIIGPTPDASYEVQLNFFYKPESLVDSPTGTWLSVNAYKCLLFGTLVQASTYMKRNGGVDNMADYYGQEFLVGLQGLKNLGESRDRKDTYRSGEKRKSEAA